MDPDLTFMFIFAVAVPIPLPLYVVLFTSPEAPELPPEPSGAFAPLDKLITVCEPSLTYTPPLCIGIRVQVCSVSVHFEFPGFFQDLHHISGVATGRNG